MTEYLFRLIFGVVFMLVFSFIYFGVRHIVNSMRYRGYNRDLSLDEQNYIISLAEDIIEDAASAEYPWYYNRLFLSLCILPVCGISVFIYWISFKFLKNKVTIQQYSSDLFYLNMSPTDFSFSGVIALFLGMMVLGLVSVFFIPRSSPLERKYANYELGWGKLDGSPRDEDDIAGDVLDLYLKRRIEFGEKISPDQIYTLVHEGATIRWSVGTGFTLVLFVVFFLFDVFSYRWINQDGFVKNPYFSLTEQSFTFDEIETVERNCRVTKSSNNPPKAHLEYIVVGPNDLKFDLGHEPWQDKLRLIKMIESTVPNKSTLNLKVAGALGSVDDKLQTCRQNLKHQYAGEIQKVLNQIYPEVFMRSNDIPELRTVRIYD